MFIDAVRFQDALERLGYRGAKKQAVETLIPYLERTFGAEFMIRREVLSDARMREVVAYAHRLKKAGVIRWWEPRQRFADEPLTNLWVAGYSAAHTTQAAGGARFDDDAGALTSALAEGLERHIWSEHTDFFKKPFEATRSSAAAHTTVLDIHRLAGFSEAQRAADPDLALSEDRSYLWIAARSLISNEEISIPAQLVSAAHARRARVREGMLRTPVTTGLATGPNKTFSLLSGALEAIERDAYMIMWLNQLTLPRFDPYSIAPRGSTLRRLLDRCARYHLRISAIRLITDAPTYVMCAVVEDELSGFPRVTVGFSAHRSAATALESAIMEGIRSRSVARAHPEKIAAAAEMEPQELKLEDRVAYWCTPERASLLDFLTAGPMVELDMDVSWHADTEAAHLTRILDWLRASDYECLAVDLGRSSANPLPWSVHMVLIPELQPMHLRETHQYLGGDRLRNIPIRYGYAARDPLFTEEPHPLA